MRLEISNLARIAWTACIVWLASSTVYAHELAENRATLVLRDKTHLTLTLYVALPELMYRTLGTGQSLGAFLVQYSGMDPTSFQREMLRAQAQIERGTYVFLEDGRPLPLGRWQWPGPAAAQAMLREHVMHETVGGDVDGHGAPAEIRTEAVAKRDIRSVSVQFPAVLQQVLVVAYQPTQAWVPAGARSASIEF
jgi:hypothetical protein